MYAGWASARSGYLAAGGGPRRHQGGLPRDLICEWLPGTGRRKKVKSSGMFEGSGQGAKRVHYLAVRVRWAVVRFASCRAPPADDVPARAPRRGCRSLQRCPTSCVSTPAIHAPFCLEAEYSLSGSTSGAPVRATMGPINSLWFKWKSLRLPWRRSFLVGTQIP